MNILYKLLLSCIILILNASTVFGQIKLPKIICNNMILQRGQEIPVWGWATAGKNVSVKFAGQQKMVQAGVDGYWKVLLSPLKASSKPQAMEIGSDTSVIKITNILVGEVWFCSGQSNMNFRLHSDKNGLAELASVNNDLIREFRSEMPAGNNNPENVDNSRWKSAIGDSAENFTAVGYYFARQLYAKEKVPVGLVLASSGNTRIETWTDTTVLKKEPAAAWLLNYWQEHRKNAKLNFLPGAFYSASVAPLVPYAFKGVIWYQGESNTLPDKTTPRTATERATEYKPLLKTLITSWRNVWGKPNLPFYLIQLPGYIDPSGTNIQWAMIRQAQLDVSKELPNVSVIVNADQNGHGNLHPSNKEPAGTRTAAMVLVNEYHDKNDAPGGPIAEKLTVDKDRAIIDFKYTGKGLTGKDGDMLTGFEIADAASPDVFVSATATIKGKQVIITAAGVNKPAAVRYAWVDAPEVSLYNKAGLPASPFLISK
jgi:sialate O-acetylesterase